MNELESIWGPKKSKLRVCTDAEIHPPLSALSQMAEPRHHEPPHDFLNIQ